MQHHKAQSTALIETNNISLPPIYLAALHTRTEMPVLVVFKVMVAYSFAL